MDLIKKMLKYVFVLAIIMVVVCALICGILFIFPSLSLFGFRYASNHKQNIAIEAKTTESVNLLTVNVETNNYNIIIKPNCDESEKNPDNENLRVVINNNFTGFSNNGLNSVQIKNNQTGEFEDVSNFDSKNFINFKNDGELNIVLKEPSGIISFGTSSVIIYLPENIENNVVYNLKTNSGKISFEKNSYDTTKVVSTGDITLSVAGAKGSFNLDNAAMADGSNLNITNYIGRVEINSEKIGNVFINSNSGNFVFKQIGYEGFDGGNLTVVGNNPYVTVKGKVFGNVVFKNIVTGFADIDQINGELIYESENGILRVNKVLNNVTIINNSGEITIKQIGENNGTYLPVNITSNSAKITLGTNETKIYSLTQIDTKTSKVVIKNLAFSGSNIPTISTTKGSVDVEFSDDENVKNLTISTQSGAISLKNVYGKIDAQTGNSSKIYAEFKGVCTNSNFVTDGGEIELKLPYPTTVENKKYSLNVLNKQKNKLNIEIGGFSLTEFEGDKDADGYYNFNRVFPQSETTDNVINVKSNSGKIKIHN